MALAALVAAWGAGLAVAFLAYVLAGMLILLAPVLGPLLVEAGARKAPGPRGRALRMARVPVA